MTALVEPPQMESRDDSQSVFDEGAEMSVLGALLLDTHRQVLPDILGMLNPEDFYRPAHATIYEAILALDARSEPYDAVTVASELLRAKTLGRIGGPAYQVATDADTAYFGGRGDGPVTGAWSR